MTFKKALSIFAFTIISLSSTANAVSLWNSKDNGAGTKDCYCGATFNHEGPCHQPNSTTNPCYVDKTIQKTHVNSETNNQINTIGAGPAKKGGSTGF